MYCCTVVLLYCCTVVLLYCCTVVLLYMVALTSSFYNEEHKFEAANGEVLYCMKKGTIAILISPELFIQIQNVCYVLKAFTNLISMSILKRCGWSYLNKDDHMLLIKAAATIRAKLIKQNIYHLVMYRSKDVIITVQGQ